MIGTDVLRGWNAPTVLAVNTHNRSTTLMLVTVRNAQAVGNTETSFGEFYVVPDEVEGTTWMNHRGGITIGRTPTGRGEACDCGMGRVRCRLEALFARLFQFRRLRARNEKRADLDRASLNRCLRHHLLVKR